VEADAAAASPAAVSSPKPAKISLRTVRIVIAAVLAVAMAWWLSR
jgi:hypothetical protein